MQVFEKLPETSEPKVLALGTFDGLHRGHLAVLGQALELASELRANSSVFTFDPEPAVYFSDQPARKRRLLTVHDKLSIIENLGFDTCVKVGFSEKFARMSPEKFFRDVLVERLNTHGLVVGSDFRFGQEGSGDTERLQELADKYDLEVRICDSVRYNGEPVSSSRVRELVSAGKVKQVRPLLTRPYTVYEAVQTGRGEGKKLGFPTLNFGLGKTLRPRSGVYLVWLGTESRLPGVANFGTAPTLGRLDQPVLEVHCLDEPLNLQPGDLTHVYFANYLREEKDFATREILIEEIQSDVERARVFFDSNRRPRPLHEQPILAREEKR